METTTVTVRPSTPTASVLSVLPTPPWGPAQANLWSSPITCGHTYAATVIATPVHAGPVGLFAAAQAGAPVAAGAGVRSVVAMGGKDSGVVARIDGNGKWYGTAGLISLMSAAVVERPESALRRDVDVPGGIPPRGRPD